MTKELQYQFSSGNFEPILLVGPPGCGKTEFAIDLSNSIDWQLFKFNLASLDPPHPLVGSDYTWHNSGPGNVLKHLVENNSDFGVLLLDEVSHLSSDGRKNYPILPVLLELLDSPKELKDLWANQTFSTKNFLKIATGNDLSGLNSALLDRFKLIHVKRPKVEQLLQIIAIMVKELNISIDTNALQKLAKSSRSLRKIDSDLKRLAHQCKRTSSQITLFLLKNIS